MNRISLLSAALALMAAPAFAGGQLNSAPNQLNSAPNHQNAPGSGVAKHASPNVISPGEAPTVSTALGTALSVGGPDGSPNGNSPTITPGDGITKKPTVQLNGAPAVQAGVAVGVAIDGNASARATNSNGGGQGSGAR
jgi:hypothetical protein